MRFLLQISCILFIVLGVNLISFSHYKHWDFSRSHRFSLSEQGSVLFSGINQPAHMILYFSPTSLTLEAELYNDLKALVAEYQIKGRENLIVEYVDPIRNLPRARVLQSKYKFDPNENVIILDYLEHQKVIPIRDLAEYDSTHVAQGKKPSLLAFRGEQVINSALIELSGHPLKKIYFLQGHGEMIPGLPPLEIIGRYLQWQHVSSSLLNLSTTLHVPQEASLLVLAGARVDLSEEELKVLRDYWHDSGRLLILLDPTADTPLIDRFLQEVGITPCHDRVIRSDEKNHTILRDVTGFFVPGSEFTKQFLDLNISFLGTTQSLALEAFPQENKEKRVRPLIEALYEFWGSYRAVDQSEQELAFQVGRDRSSPLIIAAMADHGALQDDRLALHAARMIVVGNADFIKDPFLGEVGLDFFSSSLNGLIDRVMLTGKTAKMKSYFTLNLSTAEMNRIALWSLVLIPFFIGVLGFFLLWKRRKA